VLYLGPALRIITDRNMDRQSGPDGRALMPKKWMDVNDT